MSTRRKGIVGILDVVYDVSGGIAAVFMLIILVIIVAQMVARWTGSVLPGSTNFAGYAMASATFFAMAYTLKNGAHIRVNLFLSKLGRFRRIGELWCFAVGGALATYFAYFAIRATYFSWKLNDISQGQDAWPIWIPQLGMAFGTTILAVALIDHFIQILFGSLPSFISDSKDRL